jgi:hypothetical protein
MRFSVNLSPHQGQMPCSTELSCLKHQLFGHRRPFIGIVRDTFFLADDLLVWDRLKDVIDGFFCQRVMRSIEIVDLSVNNIFLSISLCIAMKRLA